MKRFQLFGIPTTLLTQYTSATWRITFTHLSLLVRDSVVHRVPPDPHKQIRVREPLYRVLHSSNGAERYLRTRVIVVSHVNTTAGSNSTEEDFDAVTFLIILKVTVSAEVGY